MNPLKYVSATITGKRRIEGSDYYDIKAKLITDERMPSLAEGEINYTKINWEWVPFLHYISPSEGNKEEKERLLAWLIVYLMDKNEARLYTNSESGRVDKRLLQDCGFQDLDSGLAVLEFTKIGSLV